MKARAMQHTQDPRRAAAQHIQAQSARVHALASALLQYTSAVVIALALAAALVAFATPCDAASLCMAAVITPTRRRGPLARLWARACTWYLRQRLASAEFDLQVMQQQYEHLPTCMAYYRDWIAITRVELMDAEAQAAAPTGAARSTQGPRA